MSWLDDDGYDDDVIEEVDEDYEEVPVGVCNCIACMRTRKESGADIVPEDANLDPKRVYRTQKVKGVLALNAIGANTQGYIPYVPALNFRYVIDLTKDPEEELNTYAKMSTYTPCYPVFARPCPVVPRHGFVDSRLVNSREELAKVMAETKAVEPEGEVMLMVWQEAVLNVIYTPAFLTLGAGHDGATAGKNTVTYPLTGEWDTYIKAACKAGSVKDYPYVELVFTKSGNERRGFMTQLRNGPKLDRKVDFIPKDMVVSEVIEADPQSSDLLGWETLMLANKGKDGVVVYHPGGSQSDHFSIHARSCGIPCITSFKPQVGQILEPIGTVPLSYQSVLKGLLAGSLMKFNESSGTFVSEGVMMLMGLHNVAAFEGEAGQWIGAAIMMMLRLGSIALRGEARHLNPNRGPRQSLYRKVANYRIGQHASVCTSLINLFRYGWQYGQGGVGGYKWAQCALTTGNLFNAVREFAIEQNDETYGKMLREFNTAINQAHNGGWWMNKFLSQRQFEYVQEGNLSTFMSGVPAIWDLSQIAKQLSPEDVEKGRQSFVRWPIVKPKPVQVISATIDWPLGSRFLTLKVVSRLLKQKHAIVKINMEPVMKRVPRDWPLEFFVRHTDEGLALDMLAPGHIDEPIEIWRDPKVTAQSGKLIG